MPKIKLDHVISFSSEDPVHVANNILDSNPAKKWKCKEAGEKSATIVLQLEKASLISALDIGNENSAYIEVLVTRSGLNDEFKVLLVMSSFMTPLEARQGNNINKVRMFTQDHLSKPECEQKWDRMKIVCTQPFNRHVQYGLSFITLHTPGDKANGTPTQATLGKFTIRPDSPVNNLSPGGLFARRSDFQKEEPLSAAAAIREASTSLTPKPKLKINKTQKISSHEENETKKPQPRNRNELLYSKDEEEPNIKIDKIIEKKIEEKKAKDEQTKPVKKVTTPSTSEESNNKRKQHQSNNDSSRNKKIKVAKEQRPFHQLLKGCTLAISGILNPDRRELREKAQAMGAKYKADWDDSCTHLICAFVNTPKFNKVKGKGKIVKRNWIEECHKQRKNLPWRRFCLDKSDANQPESEDEIWEQVEGVNINDSSDEDGFEDSRMQQRIAEIQAKQNEKLPDAFGEETDEETFQPEDIGDISSRLPDFLHMKTFFIDETLDEEVSNQLERYIIAYKGIIAENPFDGDIDYFITSEMNVKNLKTYNGDAVFIRPDWVWECHNNQNIVSTDGYLL